MMKATKIAAGLAVAMAAPSSIVELKNYGFEDFCAEFGKSYKPHELAQREALFDLSMQSLLAHNSNPVHSWKMGINKFSDLTDAEIKAFKGRAGRPQHGFSTPPRSFFENLQNVSDLPKEVDWRKDGIVTPTKDQESCGSCWAFSAVEVLESHIALQTGKLLTLSPQQMVSCAEDPLECGGTGGCEGATQWIGFNYTIAAGGLSLDKDYPYSAETDTCRNYMVKPAVGIKDYVRLPTNDYKSLMNAVATIGPVAISLDAGFSSYQSGVLKTGCGTTIDHAVVLVGYGTDPEEGDYYLVRNSWGSKWGEDGYIRIARNDDDSENCGVDDAPADGTMCKPYPETVKVCGLCGILADSSFPTGGYLV